MDEKIEKQLKKYPKKFELIKSVCCNADLLLMGKLVKDVAVLACSECWRVEMVFQVSDLEFVGNYDYGLIDNDENKIISEKLTLWEE